MTRYYWNRDKRDWTTEPQPRPEHGIYLTPDLKPFKSPLEGHKVIDGRAALREELARNSCRIVDPTEWKAEYTNPHFAKRRGLPLYGEKR